jgi:hypothetical protein
MKRVHHPGYSPYRKARQASQLISQAVELWRESGLSIRVQKYGLIWTPESASEFVESLARIFQAYNQTLWDIFPYCTLCQGGCCLVESPRISPFDMIALALLDEPFPFLPEYSLAQSQACVYLLSNRCAWPATWRTMKCWTFYCLGGEGWQLSDPHDTRYNQMATALLGILRQGMPPELLAFEGLNGNTLTSNIINPLDFAEGLDHALEEIFVQPFNARFPTGVVYSMAEITDADTLLEGEIFDTIANMVERIEVEQPGSSEETLADLEMLEMILFTMPENRLNLLHEIALRYGGAEADSVKGQMRDLVGKLLFEV